MKDLILILLLAAIFVFGYFVMAKLDLFITQSRRSAAEEKRSRRSPPRSDPWDKPRKKSQKTLAQKNHRRKRK